METIIGIATIIGGVAAVVPAVVQLIKWAKKASIKWAKKPRIKNAEPKAPENRVEGQAIVQPAAAAAGTMAQYMDQLIAEGRTLEQIAALAQAESTARGLRLKYSKGTIQAHINFRAKQAEKKAAKQAEE